ncbi:NADPH-dependent 1-acyldihydroxyacetone phosphate [Cyphellophora attinorum]|uniref:NADPH-dependent 1-acyldihydroxyacetone phosphate n=1 Tax=Cyphellophora attinorum TaxID=1664694 RepID=A0A0N0NJW6_9EURO|nr:NADPH-dependent 1-acyldihydroxyacetone phosphate [Phialophora attinorum]KPI37119.1 NADPH-dependent 1-acyldihydroxyacetone phosphate [Phialophora attinorum]
MPSQRSVLITGCSQGGIGDALAQRFHEEGLLVFASARNLAKVEHLKTLGIHVLQLDVVDHDSIARTVREITSLTSGKLDVLINNSGGGYAVPLLDSDARKAKDMFEVNVFALISVTKAFFPLLTTSKGTVVNIGSVLGYTPYPWSGWYNASKAAANLLTDQLRVELEPFGVRVVLVVAGAIKTKFMENLADLPHLLPSSPYYPARGVVEEVMSGSELEKGAADVNVVARAIVKNVLQTTPKKHHWLGGGSSTIWLAHTFGWATVWDFLWTSAANLGTVSQILRTKQKST